MLFVIIWHFISVDFICRVTIIVRHPRQLSSKWLNKNTFLKGKCLLFRRVREDGYDVQENKQTYRSIAVVKPLRHTSQYHETHKQNVFGGPHYFVFKESISCGFSGRHRNGKHLKSKKKNIFIYLRLNKTGLFGSWVTPTTVYNKCCCFLVFFNWLCVLCAVFWFTSKT